MKIAQFFIKSVRLDCKKLNCVCKVGLAHMVSFFVIELTHLDLNFKFDIVVAFMINYSFSHI
jgi:hypothetical protein